MIDPVLARLDADRPQALDRLMEFLKIPSISTDPAYDGDVQRAAEWLANDLKSFGVPAEIHPTSGHPMVTGTLGDGGPHLLFYGHYDVQPVDPIDLWHRDPFDAALEDTAAGQVIRARGASDDKGQLMTFVEAARAWASVHGSLPCRITFFFEGEEESGSPSLLPYLDQNKGWMSEPDIALICDTSRIGEDRPAITTQLRGLLGEEITVHAASRDLHSGSFGGAAANPIRILTRILADLHGPDGRIQIPGFYDGVEETSSALRADWDALGITPEDVLGDVGLSHPAGETGRDVLEMLWARPTAEINGITGGYTGAGFKTVLPAQASAKVSFRLVGRQDPAKIREAFHSFVQERLPADCRVEFAPHGAGPASVMDTDHPVFAATRAALDAEWAEPAAFVGAGGSIPIAGYFKTILGLDSILLGFAREDDQIHSPNEKYDVKSFEKGTRSWARLLGELA
ncbi:MAG: M20/M25/M40 family metallo-hydrolase [Pseudomonadota bacterium]